MVYALSMALFNTALTIDEFPERHDLTGLGLTDDWRYADRLAAKLAYRNTFYDQEPLLDIMDPPADLHGKLDFLTSSDVFEHVAPPVERAFENSLRLLKPGGSLIVTVPYQATGDLIEHFPNLHEYQIVEFSGQPVLLNRTRRKSWEVFEDIHFHGGVGATLEMRSFARPALLELLRATGFEDITVWETHMPFGIAWEETQGFPVTARRPSAER